MTRNNNAMQRANVCAASLNRRSLSNMDFANFLIDTVTSEFVSRVFAEAYLAKQLAGWLAGWLAGSWVDAITVCNH